MPIAKKSLKVVFDQIEDPQYRTIAKQIVKKFGAGLYGKAGSGLTGKGLRGQGLSNSGLSETGMKKNPAVMPRYGEDRILPERGKRYSDYQERIGDIVEDRGRNVIKPYPNRMPRFGEGSQEAKDYMASIRNNNQGSGFFSKLGKEIKKGAKEAGKDFKKGASKGKKHFLANELVMKRHLYCPLLVEF